MTDREKAIVMAYTGIVMLTGEKLNAFYEYLAELYGRPVYTHEIAVLDIQSKCKPDFVELCRNEEPQRKKGRWTEDEACPFCGFQPWYENDIHTLSYCGNCGADLKEGGDTDAPTM